MGAYAKLAELVLEPVAAVDEELHRLHAGCARGFDVGFEVVDEDALAGRQANGFGGERVDARLRLCDANVGRADDGVEQRVDADVAEPLGERGIRVTQDGGAIRRPQRADEIDVRLDEALFRAPVVVQRREGAAGGAFASWAAGPPAPAPVRRRLDGRQTFAHRPGSP